MRDTLVDIVKKITIPMGKYVKTYEQFETFNPYKYNSFSELTEQDLYDIALWGVDNEFSSTGAIDYVKDYMKGRLDQEDIERFGIKEGDTESQVLLKVCVDDLKMFLSMPYPQGFGGMPKEVTLYRFVSLSDESALDRNKLGYSWLADLDILKDGNNDFFGQMIHLTKDKDHNKSLYLITALIPESNIDIPRSLWLRSANSHENEVRLKDDRSINILNVKKY